MLEVGEELKGSAMEDAGQGSQSLLINTSPPWQMVPGWEVRVQRRQVDVFGGRVHFDYTSFSLCVAALQEGASNAPALAMLVESVIL